MVDWFRPTVLPIDPAGTPDRGYGTMRVTSPYGEREGSFAGFHGGLDIGNARLGDEVIAAADGTVIHATNQPLPPWNYPSPTAKLSAWGPSYGGNVIVVRHASGVWSQYVHLADMLPVVGQAVDQGEVIGHIGQTGSAAPPPNGGGGHLHFGIRLRAQIDNGHNGWVDPWPLIQPTGTLEEGTMLDRCREQRAYWRGVADRRLQRIVILRDRIAELEQLDAAKLQAALASIRAEAEDALAEVDVSPEP